MRPALVFAALLLVAGCDVFSDSEPTYSRAPGVLLIGDPSTPTIQVPSQIRPGVPTQITVTTRSVGCNERGDTGVEFVDGAVEIRPFDVTRVFDEPRFCTLEEKPNHPHTVAVTFLEAGPILVRAVGESRIGYNDDGMLQTQVQTRELGIVVR